MQKTYAKKILQQVKGGISDCHLQQGGRAAGEWVEKFDSYFRSFLQRFSK